MSDFYRLEGTEPVLCGREDWSKHPTRSLQKDELPNGYRVSTVFLGLDHSFGGPVPILFETMVFAKGSWHDLDCVRYATHEEAMAGHREMVEKWSKKEGGI